DALQVQVPKGSYVPQFIRVRAPAAVVGASIVTPIRPGEPEAGAESKGYRGWSLQERRLVTVLSCALTDRASQYSTSSDLLSLLEGLHERCAAIGLDHGGEVDASAGDRLLVYFGWPNAFEDAPGRALTA